MTTFEEFRKRKRPNETVGQFINRPKPALGETEGGAEDGETERMAASLRDSFRKKRRTA